MSAVRRVVLIVGVALALLAGVSAAASLPKVVDVSGKLQIGCGFDGIVSAPKVCRAGRVIGVYIDDSTPNLSHWLRVAIGRYSAPGNLIIVSVAPGHPAKTYGPIPLVITCHEFYPENAGRPIRVVERSFPKRKRCYVIQHFYGGLATQWGAPPRPPTAAQYRFNLLQARAQHPQLILGF